MGAPVLQLRKVVVPVRTPSATYNVEIGTGLLPHVGPSLNQLLEGKLLSGNLRVFVITSPNLETPWAELLLSGFTHRPEILSVPSGEMHKRFATVERLCEELAQRGADRDSLLIALGGGVTGDLTGFLAAVYMRGIRYVQVPTTLLAQVDSSVGGKTGVNLGAGKNLVGAFHHPLVVYADTDTLQTLPANQLRAGLQEAIKSSIIRDPALFDFLDTQRSAVLRGDPDALTEVIAQCVRIKADVVGADEYESGVRMLLNLGHTLGHALEAATNYTNLLHGEAIAWGMLAALDIARGRALVNAEEASRISAVIRAYGPLKPFSVSAEDLVALTAKDKKNRGGTRSFVLPVGIGNATVVHDVGEAELLRSAQCIVREAKQISAG